MGWVESHTQDIPIVNQIIPAILDNPISDAATHAINQAGDTINDVAANVGSFVDNSVPGGWATIGAAALAAATLGGSLAAEGALGAGEGLAAAGEAGAEIGGAGSLAGAEAGVAGTEAGLGASAELDAAGSMAEQAAASQAAAAGAGAGTGLGAGAGLGTVATGDAVLPGALANVTGDAVLPGALANVTGDAVLPGALAGDATAGFNTNALINSALTGAGKGALTNVAIDVLTGQPITPKGVATGALLGGVGGGAGNVAGQLGAGTIGSGIAGGATAGGTGALIGGGNVGKGALIGGLAGGTSAGVTDLTGVPVLGSVAGKLASNAANNALTPTPTSSSPSPTTSSPSPEATLAALLAGGALGVSNNTTTPSGGLTVADIPKSTLSKGDQISSPLASNYNIPVMAYNIPQNNPQSLQEIENAKNGGIIHRATGGSTKSPLESNVLEMKPQLMHGSQAPHANLFGTQGIPLYSLPSRADGGSLSMEDRTLPEGHNPQFFSEGGLNSIKHRYVTGDGDGTSDSIPAMLANGEFVIPADVVSSLGNGSNDSGAKVLDELLNVIREHKQQHDAKNLPPDSKGALAYLLKANKQARA